MLSRLILFAFLLNINCISIAFAQNAVAPEYSELLKKAFVEYRAGRWDKARTLFRGAHEIDPNAHTLRGLGMASLKTRDYVSTIKYLKEALSETRRPLTKKQRIQAQEILTRANGFVGRLRVVLQPSNAHLTIDGIPRKLEGNNELLVNPGRIELVAEAEGYKTLQRNIDLAGGKNRIVRLTLEPISGADPKFESPIRSSEQSSLEEERESSASLIPYIVTGFGGALLVGSAVTGAIAYEADSELEEACDPDGFCPKEHESTIETRDTLQVVSLVLLGTGLAASVTGLVLLLTEDSEQEKPSTSNVSLRCRTDGCLGVLSSVF